MEDKNKESLSKKNWYSAVIEEYKACRNENLQADRNANLILRIFLIGMSVLIGTAANLWSTEIILSEIILLVFIPLFVYVVGFMWIGEVARKVRIGLYVLNKVEPKINREFKQKEPAINWESYLRSEHDNKINKLFMWHHKAKLAILLGAALSSIFVGNYKVVKNLSRCDHSFISNNIVIIDIGELIVFSVVVTCFIIIGKNFK